MTNSLKTVLPKLIGREQSGFLAGCCPFDNIIALQEVVHSIERSINEPL